MKIKIDQSPYGDSGAEYDGALGMFNHFKLQLEHFHKTQAHLKTPEEMKALEADIAGYDEVLKSNSQKNARAFMKYKRDPETHEDRFESNIELVNWLKANGHWEAKP